jgi:hypothetical protein
MDINHGLASWYNKKIIYLKFKLKLNKINKYLLIIIVKVNKI